MRKPMYICICECKYVHIFTTRRITHTLPETDMEIQKGPMKTTVPLKGGYMGFHVSLGECIKTNIVFKSDPQVLEGAR